MLTTTGLLVPAWLPFGFCRRGRGELRKLLLEADQELPEQPGELGLLSLGECPEHSPFGLEMARSRSCDQSSSLPGEGDEEPAAVVLIHNPLDEPGLLQAVDQVRHPAGRAHEGSVELGRRTPVRRAYTPEGGQGIPARPVQSKAAEVLVQTTVEQDRSATDPRNDRDRRRVESGLFLPPLCEHTVDMVSS